MVALVVVHVLISEMANHSHLVDFVHIKIQVLDLPRVNVQPAIASFQETVIQLDNVLTQLQN